MNTSASEAPQKVLSESSEHPWVVYIGAETPLQQKGVTGVNRRQTPKIRELTFSMIKGSFQIYGNWFIQSPDGLSVFTSDLGFRARYVEDTGALNLVRLHTDALETVYWRLRSAEGIPKNMGSLHLTNEVGSSLTAEMIDRHVDSPLEVLWEGNLPTFTYGYLPTSRKRVFASATQWHCFLEIPGERIIEAIIDPTILLKTEALRFSIKYLKSQCIFYRMHQEDGSVKPWQLGSAGST